MIKWLLIFSLLVPGIALAQSAEDDFEAGFESENDLTGPNPVAD